jgi:hypothetical protein
MMPTRKPRTRGDKVIGWIEDYCVYPNGPQRGQPVALTVQQVVLLRRLLDEAEHPTLDATLSSYLALFFIAGPEHGSELLSAVEVDSFTVWSATGTRLRDVLRREGETIVCPALGTRFPWAA